VSCLGAGSTDSARYKASFGLERAHACGFSRLSIDLIYATALDTTARVEKELQRAFSLPITGSRGL